MIHRCLISVLLSFLTTLQLNFHKVPRTILRKYKSDHATCHTLLKISNRFPSHLEQYLYCGPQKSIGSGPIPPLWPHLSLSTPLHSSHVLSFHSRTCQVHFCLKVFPYWSLFLESLLHRSSFACVCTSLNLYSAVTSSQWPSWSQSCCPHSPSLTFVLSCFTLFFLALMATWSNIIYFCFLSYFPFFPKDARSTSQGPWLSCSLLCTHPVEQHPAHSKWSKIFVEERNTQLSLSSEIWWSYACSVWRYWSNSTTSML